MTADLAPRRPARARVRASAAAWRWAWPSAAGASVLAVVGLWLAGDGARALVASPAACLASVGRIAGLLSADLLLVQVLLMARIPALERAYGQDVLARVHRVVGFSSVSLLGLHIAAVTAGYAGLQGTSIARQAWILARTYPGVLLAVAGTAALGVVTATSIRAARRALRYESWHLLHLYAYLGVGLALPHQLWSGSDFVRSPVARAYWWTLYGAVAASVLAFRVALPIWRTVRHGLTVHSVVQESPGVVSVRMQGRALHRLPARAGQYAVWRFRDGPGWTHGHPYSLSAAPGGDIVRITARESGDDPGRLARLRPGTRVFLEGPYGRTTAASLRGRRVALLAGGIGITPIRALLDDLPAGPDETVVVYRAHSAADLILRAEIDALAARRGVTVHYLLGPRPAGRASWLPAASADRDDAHVLLDLVPDLAERTLVVCGPEGWADAVCTAAAAAGLPPGRVRRERFVW